MATAGIVAAPRLLPFTAKRWPRPRAVHWQEEGRTTTHISDTSSVRVLLVEDSGVLARRIAELIRRLSRIDLIGTVDTEADALQRVASSAPDVLILDLHLRSGSGFGVLRSLTLWNAPRPKVIVLTGFDLPQYRQEAETLGVDAFLNKSRDYHRLAVLLRAYAAQSGATNRH